jgi:hypothetical protein
MAEISPPEVRGSLMALEQFAIVLGVVLGFWTGFLTRTSAFRFGLFRTALTQYLFSRRISIMANTTRNPIRTGYLTLRWMSLLAALSATIGIAWSS